MVKNKGKIINEVESDYAEDSMIENGTSDESDDNSNKQDNKPILYSAPKKINTKVSQVEATKRKYNNNDVTAPASSTATAQTAKKIKTSDKVKPPTLEEINELKETRNLFHSNLFRLQVKEMLSELKVKEKYVNFVQTWLENFNIFLSSLQSQTNKEDISAMQWLKKCAIQVPLNLQHLRIQQQKSFHFQFIKPSSSPYLIGAAATQTLLGPKLIADICVPMPAECFQKDNYLNLLYDQKRAYYLTYIGNQLLNSAKCGDLKVENLKFSYYANNPLKPILEVIPSRGDLGKSFANKISFRIFVAAEEKSFKLNRFVPWNNNIRASLFGDDDDDAIPLATPSYNASVLFDLTLNRNQQLQCEVFGASKNFQDGLILLKIWLRQRELHIGFSGFNTQLLAMFIVYLYKQRKLHTSMSSYQVARTVWNQLAFSAWEENNKGISLCNNTDEIANQPTIDQFHAHYEVVFVDSTGFYNIASNLSLEIYKRLRLEAKLAVDMLNDMKLNSFQLIFMTKSPLYSQFDHMLKINKDDIIEQILEMHVSPADKYNFAGYTYPQLLKVVGKLLNKGLGERVLFLIPIEQSVESWPCVEQPINCGSHLHLGFILNPEKAFEVLDKGPESLAEEAPEFRKFWGDKAQLRRFQDGSITESVVWAASTDSQWKKRLVVRSIVLHLLQHHFQLDSKDVEYFGGELEIAYRLTPTFKADKLNEKYKISQDIDAEDTSLNVIRSFDDLARKLHGLNELPLEIVTIAGISPVFRYCDPNPILPQARFIGDNIHAIHVQHGIMQLGLSSKWPNELGALRALKTAFYIQIAQQLREKYKLRTKVTYDGVMVLKQGFCFAIEMAHPKEVTLLKKEKSERGITQYVDCDASIAMEKRHYILPKVTGALHALHQLHPSFGGTVMIAKRWLYTQLLDNGLWPDECTELLIASQFLKTHTQQVTCSPQTGFIRFLQMLAHTDWKTELFLLNFNYSMDENAVSELEQRFNAERDTFPPLCIVTSYDKNHKSHLWTSNSCPNVNVMARVVLLARETLTIIEASLLTTASVVKPARFFQAPCQGYDLVIRLKPDMIPNALVKEYGSSFVEFTKPNWRLPLADSNFVNNSVVKLREAYGDFAAFFYNPCGGKEIAVIWKPNLNTEKDFKVNEVNGYHLSSTNGKKVFVQKEILVEDFKFILKDFYMHIGSVETVRNASRTIQKNQETDIRAIKKKGKRYFNELTTSSTDNEIKLEVPLIINKNMPLKEIKSAQKKSLETARGKKMRRLTKIKQ